MPQVYADGCTVELVPCDKQPAWERAPRAYFVVNTGHDVGQVKITKDQARRIAGMLLRWADKGHVKGKENGA